MWRRFIFHLLTLTDYGLVVCMLRRRPFMVSLGGIMWKHDNWGLSILPVLMDYPGSFDPNWALLDIGSTGFGICGWWIIDKRKTQPEED